VRSPLVARGEALVRSIRGGMSHSGTCQPPGSQESPAGRSRHRTPDTEQGRSSRLVHRVVSLLFARPRVAKATGLTGLDVPERHDELRFTGDELADVIARHSLSAVRSEPAVLREPCLQLLPARMRLLRRREAFGASLAVRFADCDVPATTDFVDLAAHELPVLLEEMKHGSPPRAGCYRRHHGGRRVPCLGRCGRRRSVFKRIEDGRQEIGREPHF